MPNYFRPLRRKIGVVTLFLTIICLDGWINSFLDLQEFRYPTRDYGEWQLVSMRGNLQVEHLQSHSKISNQRGTYTTFQLKLPYATFTVPLFVATGFLLLPQVRARRTTQPEAKDPRQ